MTATADFEVRSPTNGTQLVVEAKNKVHASADWAARMRRNLFAHISVPSSRYFLLALPQRFYLWKDAEPHQAVPPDYEIDASELLKPYLKNVSTPLSELSEGSFELIIRKWLEDLINSDRDASAVDRSGSWLVESGLYDAIKHGFIKTQTSA
jgi:hypothetical protein